MKFSVPGVSEDIVGRASQWFFNTPERALSRAHRAAKAIQELEDKHFDGQPIGSASQLPPSVLEYFCVRRDRLLRDAKIGLTEFRWAISVVGTSSKNRGNREQEAVSTFQDVDAQRLAKLSFIDRVINRYSKLGMPPLQLEPQVEAVPPKRFFFSDSNSRPKLSDEAFKSASSTISPTQKTGIIPRSILRTGRRIQRELDLKNTDKVLKDYEISSYRTRRALLFLLTLILIPLLTQQVSKKILFMPLVEYVVQKNHIELPLNDQLEREAIEEIDFFEKQLKFESSAGIISPISYGEFRQRIEEKTQEVTYEFGHERISAIANVFADLLAAGAFAGILFANPRAVKLLKSFVDEIVYGLSDSAKAFLIIVATDMFVGFHSTHGWEVLLEGIAHHFGLPENRDFIFLFIATFPVVLDAIFKYWIFRYLSRVSPSAVATYRNMNE